VTFFSFLAFGSVPVGYKRRRPSLHLSPALTSPAAAPRVPQVLTYLVTFLGGYRNAQGIFGITCATTIVTMFLLGVTQAHITRQNRLRAGLLMTMNGSIAAAAAYVVGWGLEHAIGSGNK
jgi:hypothetical protein